MDIERRIEWGECDAAGIVFYPNFFTWMDAAFHQWSQRLGFDQNTLKKDHGISGTPAIDSSCQFKSPARFYETITITVGLKHIGNTSLILSYNMSVADRHIALGTEVRGFVADNNGQLTRAPIPDDLLKKMEISIA